MFKNYDPGLVIVNIAGIPIAGYAEGTFVTAERNVDAFTLSKGAAGDGTRTRSRDKSGTVTVTIKAESPTNDALSALAAQDELLGTGVGALSITNLNSTTLVESPIAWIRKVSNLEHGDAASNREWVFECDELFMFVGGAVV